MAIYTRLSETELRDYLAGYDIGTLQSFKGIADGITNTNYLIETDRGQYILTLFEKRFKLEELPYFVALMEWWRARGIVCPQPIHMKDGRALGALKEKPALIVTFLEGMPPRGITPAHVAELGKLAAHMHVAGIDFPHVRENLLSLSGWERLIDSTLDGLDSIEPGLKKLVSEEYNYLSEHWPAELPRGPVHADLFPDNIFFTKWKGSPKLSGVIDPYFSCNDFWAYDLAICVNAWCFDDRHRFQKERMQALMQSYNEIRSMTAEEDQCFPILLRGAALRFLLTRSYDWLHRHEDAEVTYKEPSEYIAKLKFHQTHNHHEKTR